jgi:hypothetical protein
MTLWRSLRPRGGDALPFILAALLLPGCVPGANQSSSSTAAPSATATVRPVVRSTVPVHVGAVHLEKPKATLIARIVPVATPRPSAARPAPVASDRPPTPFVFASPHALPRILAIDLSSLEVSSGETISGTVETTSNVASLEARIGGWSMSVPRTRIGHFEASGQLPDIPFFLKGTYTLQLIARNADGEQAERDVPITVR